MFFPPVTRLSRRNRSTADDGSAVSRRCCANMETCNIRNINGSSVAGRLLSISSVSLGLPEKMSAICLLRLHVQCTLAAVFHRLVASIDWPVLRFRNGKKCQQKLEFGWPKPFNGTQSSVCQQRIRWRIHRSDSSTAHEQRSAHHTSKVAPSD